MEQSYYERFGDEFSINSPAEATERGRFHKGSWFVSRPSLSDHLRFSSKFGVYDEPPRFEYGVSPDGNERLEEVVDANTDALSENHKHRNRNWRRIRGEVKLGSVLADAQLTTVTPEVGETIGRVLWTSDEFQGVWADFLDMVEQWDAILNEELHS